MILFALSDLHLSHRANREALPGIGRHPDDWLIVAGDVGERVEHLRLAATILTARFARVFWTPGNHDLWSVPTLPGQTAGVERYEELVGVCREFGITTPEDPYVRWPAEPDTWIAPLFLLYDYTFHPADIATEDALGWARASGVVCGDEHWLSPAPFPSRAAWCHARVQATSERLAALPAGARTVLANHWPLRGDLAVPPRVPRFSIWCGTTLTEEWGVRFGARVVVSGHLHLRTTLWRHGVRYEEVSLGYPRDWQIDRGMDYYLREVLPAPDAHRGRFVPPRDPFR